jgi:hypothetical protein
VSPTDAIEEKLDLLIALTRISIRDRLESELRAIRQDPVRAAILGCVDEWVSAGELKNNVRAATGQSEMTVKRRIADLVSLGALIRAGAGPSVRYRSSGLFDI